MAAADASPFPIKNQAYRVTFPILDADGDLVSGAAGLDSEVSKDGATFADATSEATEIATSSGMYFLDLTAAEMNADTVAIIVKTSTSGAKTTPIVLYPVTLSEAMLGVNVREVSGTVQTARDLGAQLNATVSSRATPAQVNTEVLDVLNVDTFAEPGQETPPATTTLVKKIGYLYKLLRNRVTVTATTISVYNDDAVTVDQKSTHSDDGTTYDRGEFTTGP